VPYVADRTGQHMHAADVARLCDVGVSSLTIPTSLRWKASALTASCDLLVLMRAFIGATVCRSHVNLRSLAAQSFVRCRN